jgi:hypothetical protein
VTFDPYSLSFPDTDFKTIDGELHLKRLPGYGPKAAFVGHQLVRMNRASGNRKADNSAVYDSILYPLVKAREYRKLQHSYQVDKEPYDIAIWRFPRFVYLFPVAERR